MAERISDPVCGMAVDRLKAISIDYEDSTYLFCSASYAGKFQADPGKYISSEPIATTTVSNKQATVFFRVHMPNAPRGHPSRALKLSHLRSGIRATRSLFRWNKF